MERFFLRLPYLAILILLPALAACSTSCDARPLLSESDVPAVRQSSRRAVTGRPWMKRFIDDYILNHIGRPSR